jgi:hypothetical protein
MTKNRGTRLNLKAILESVDDEIEKKDEDSGVDSADNGPQDDVDNTDKLFDYKLGTESEDEDEKKDEDENGTPDLPNVDDIVTKTDESDDEEEE